jgi:hypothetical protein
MISAQTGDAFQYPIYSTPTGFANAPVGFYADVMEAQALARSKAEQEQAAYKKLMDQPVAANWLSYRLHGVIARRGGRSYNPPGWVKHRPIPPEQYLKVQMARQEQVLRSRYPHLSPDFVLDPEIALF